MEAHSEKVRFGDSLPVMFNILQCPELTGDRGTGTRPNWTLYLALKESHQREVLR